MSANIELVLRGKCKGCPELNIETATLYADGRAEMVEPYCTNRDLCGHLERYLLSTIPTATYANGGTRA